MDETREVLGVWTYEGLHAPRNQHHNRERMKYLYDQLGGAENTPAFIWRVEFFLLPDRPADDPDRYGITLHRYARNAEGSRHRMWVKAYDQYGNAVNTMLVATVAPENHLITRLPAEYLLLGHPEPN